MLFKVSIISLYIYKDPNATIGKEFSLAYLIALIIADLTSEHATASTPLFIKTVA